MLDQTTKNLLCAILVILALVVVYWAWSSSQQDDFRNDSITIPYSASFSRQIPPAPCSEMKTAKDRLRCTNYRMSQRYKANRRAAEKSNHDRHVDGASAIKLHREKDLFKAFSQEKSKYSVGSSLHMDEHRARHKSARDGFPVGYGWTEQDNEDPAKTTKRDIFCEKLCEGRCDDARPAPQCFNLCLNHSCPNVFWPHYLHYLDSEHRARLKSARDGFTVGYGVSLKHI